MDKDFYWDIFFKTGSVESYLIYKELEYNSKNLKNEDRFLFLQDEVAIST